MSCMIAVICCSSQTPSVFVFYTGVLLVDSTFTIRPIPHSQSEGAVVDVVNVGPLRLLVRL